MLGHLTKDLDMGNEDENYISNSILWIIYGWIFFRYFTLEMKLISLTSYNFWSCYFSRNTSFWKISTANFLFSKKYPLRTYFSLILLLDEIGSLSARGLSTYSCTGQQAFKVPGLAFTKILHMRLSHHFQKWKTKINIEKKTTFILLSKITLTRVLLLNIY